VPCQAPLPIVPVLDKFRVHLHHCRPAEKLRATELKWSDNNKGNSNQLLKIWPPISTDEDSSSRFQPLFLRALQPNSHFGLSIFSHLYFIHNL
jgi:hypothetical protein